MQFLKYTMYTNNSQKNCTFKNLEKILKAWKNFTKKKATLNIEFTRFNELVIKVQNKFLQQNKFCLHLLFVEFTFTYKNQSIKNDGVTDWVV